MLAEYFLHAQLLGQSDWQASFTCFREHVQLKDHHKFKVVWSTFGGQVHIGIEGKLKAAVTPWVSVQVFQAPSNCRKMGYHILWWHRKKATIHIVLLGGSWPWSKQASTEIPKVLDQVLQHVVLVVTSISTVHVQAYCSLGKLHAEHEQILVSTSSWLHRASPWSMGTELMTVVVIWLPGTSTEEMLSARK